jgi:hypothetical protein
MFQKLEFRDKSIIFAWLISYFLILFIPVLISGVTYIRTHRVLEDEIINYNTLLLKKLQQPS